MCIRLTKIYKQVANKANGMRLKRVCVNGRLVLVLTPISAWYYQWLQLVTNVFFNENVYFEWQQHVILTKLTKTLNVQ